MLTHLALKYNFSDARTRFFILHLLGVPVSEKEQADYSFLQAFTAKIEEKIISLSSMHMLGELTSHTILEVTGSALRSGNKIEKIYLNQLAPEIALKIMSNLGHGNSVLEISLANMSFSEEQFHQLAQYLRSCGSLKSLSLQQLTVDNKFITSEPLYLIKLFEKSFSIWSNLTRIALIGMELTDRSGLIFFEYISRLPIKQLEIASMYLSIHSIYALATYIKHAYDLQELSLQKSNMNYLNEAVSITALDANGKIFRRVGGDFLLQTMIETLRWENNLTKLDMSDCAVSGRHIETMVRECSRLPLEFNLSDNEIGANARALLAKHMKNICLDAQKDELSEWDYALAEALELPKTIKKKKYRQYFELFEDFYRSGLHFPYLTEYMLSVIGDERELYAFYLGISRQLSSFLVGAQNIASGLVEPSLGNIKILGVEHGLELGTIFSGPIIPLSIGLYIVRKTLIGATRNQITNECHRLLSLLDPAHYEYFTKLLPALITILCAEKIRKASLQPTEPTSVLGEQFISRSFLAKLKPVDPFQELLDKIIELTFHAWSETTTQNSAKKSYMTARPEAWMMHMMQQIFDAEGPAQINFHLNRLWKGLEPSPVERSSFINSYRERNLSIMSINSSGQIDKAQESTNQHRFWTQKSPKDSAIQAVEELELPEIKTVANS